MTERLSSASSLDALVSPRRLRFDVEMPESQLKAVFAALRSPRGSKANPEEIGSPRALSGRARENDGSVNATKPRRGVSFLDLTGIRSGGNESPTPLSGRAKDPGDSKSRASTVSSATGSESSRTRSLTSVSAPAALEEPVSEEEEKFDKDNPLKVVHIACKILAKPLVHSHTKDDSTRKHVKSINAHQRKITNFRDTLHADYQFWKHYDFTLSYLERFHNICQMFLKNYRAIEHPQFPKNFALLTPRSKDAAQKAQKAQQEALEKIRKTIRVVELTKDALVQNCIADICVLAQEHEEKLPGAPAPADILHLGSAPQRTFSQRIGDAIRKKFAFFSKSTSED